MERSFTIRIDFTEEWFDANIDTDFWSAVENKLLDIDNVKTVCVDHCVWVEAEVGNPRMHDLMVIAEQIEKDVERVLCNCYVTRVIGS